MRHLISLCSALLTLAFMANASPSASRSSGGILVLGGKSPNGTISSGSHLASVESVNLPGTGSVSCSVPDLPAPVFSHSTTVTPSGTILSCGGFTSWYLTSSCVSWTPGTSGWSTAPADLPRKMHEGVLLTVGHTIVWSGGLDEKYNVLKGIYTTNMYGRRQMVARMREGRGSHCGVSFRDHFRAILIGGFDAGYDALSSVEEFQLGSSTTTPLPSLTVGRGYHACSLHIDNTGRPTILVSGGMDNDYTTLSSVERSTWTPAGGWSDFTVVGQLETGRAYHTMVAVGRRVFIVAGFRPSTLSTPSKSFEDWLETEDNGETWTRSSTRLTTGRSGHTSVSTDLLNC